MTCMSKFYSFCKIGSWDHIHVRKGRAIVTVLAVTMFGWVQWPDFFTTHLSCRKRLIGWTCVKFYGSPAVDKRPLYVMPPLPHPLPILYLLIWIRPQEHYSGCCQVDENNGSSSYKLVCYFVCSAWLKRENLASYKKFRQDFNEQVSNHLSFSFYMGCLKLSLSYHRMLLQNE